MQKTVKKDEFTEKGRQRYYQLKSQLERKYDLQDVVLIEVESGDYFVGKTTTEAYKKARVKYPDRQFFIAQVGRIASFLKCSLS